MTAITPSYMLPSPVHIGRHGGIGLIYGTATLVTYETSGGVDCDLSTYFAALATDGVVVFTNCPSGYVPDYAYATNKLLVYEAGADAAALDECGDGALALVFHFIVVGRVNVPEAAR